MSYKCEACNRHVRPGVARRTHAILRPNGGIERELAVCGTCAHLLDEGMPLWLVIRQNRVPEQPKPTVPAPAKCKRCHGKRTISNYEGTIIQACPLCAGGKRLPIPQTSKSMPVLAPKAVPVQIEVVLPPPATPQIIKGKVVRMIRKV